MTTTATLKWNIRCRSGSPRPILNSLISKPDGLKTFNSVRKRMPHRYFPVNFEGFLGKIFCTRPPSNHVSHDVVFSFLQPKINLFGGAMVNQKKEFTSPFNPMQFWKSGENFIVKFWPHMYPLQNSSSWRSGRKGRTEKLVNVG